MPTKNPSHNIPNAPLYVVVRDTFMSGWGESEGKENYYVVPCPNKDKAMIVLNNMRSHSNMKGPTIVERASIQELLNRWTKNNNVFVSCASSDHSWFIPKRNK